MSKTGKTKKLKLTPLGIVKQIEQLEDHQLGELATEIDIMHPLDKKRVLAALEDLFGDSDIELVLAGAGATIE